MDGLVDWYLLGVVAGLGVTAGVATLLARTKLLVGVTAVAVALAAAAAIVISALPGWALAVLGVGGLVGLLALRRLTPPALPFAVLLLAALAVVPAAGYAAALAAPIVGARVSRRADTRYAGLRVLARD
jgi:hypothetical protein